MNEPLPQGWVWTRIADVSEVQLGRQRSPKYHTGEQMRPYLRSANVTWNGVELDDVKTMNFDDVDFEKYRLQPGDILLNEASGSSSEVGKPAVWNNEIKECCFQNTLLRLQPHEIDRRYLYWYCYSSALTGRFGDAGRGVNIRHLGKKGLAQFPIPVPPFTEQERIVDRVEAILARLDSIEATLKSLVERLNHVHSAILADAFHTNSPLPNGWKRTKLGQVCKKPQYGWTTKSTHTDGLFYLRTTDISSGGIDWDSVPSCVDSPKDIGRYLLREGDIVVSRAGSVGVSHMLRNPPRAVFASYLIRLEANRDLIPEYLAFYLKSPAYWKAISENKIGIAIPNVNARKLAEIPIPVPQRTEQESIIERIESYLSRLNTIDDSVKQALRGNVGWVG